MNLKRTFGTILTTLGIIILIYGGYSFITGHSQSAWKIIITTMILGIIFFGSGISLVRGTRDDA